MSDRLTRSQPFCWQEKKILRLLRKEYSGAELSKLRCLYGTITEMDSDFNGREIKFYTKSINTYSGLSKEWIPKGLKILEELNIIKIFEMRINGKFQGKHIVFTPEKLEELPRMPNAGKPVIVGLLTGFSEPSEDSPIKKIVNDKNIQCDNPENVKTHFQGISTDFLKRIHDSWIEHQHLIQNKWGTFMTRIKSGVKTQLIRFSDNPDDLIKSIKNYAGIVKSSQHYWTKKWTLWDFITRGADNFLDESEPWESYKKSNPGGKENSNADDKKSALKAKLEQYDV